MTHNPSWLYADYKVYEESLGINESKTCPSNLLLNIKFSFIFLISTLKTVSKLYHLTSLKIDNDQFFELVLYDEGDHSNKIIKKDSLSKPKFISIFDQKRLFKSSTFSLLAFTKICLKNYKIASKVLRMPQSNLKKTIIDNLFSSIPNSIFYEYFFNDLISHKTKFKIVSSSCLIFPLTIAGNLNIDIQVKMHGLMGKILPMGFPKLKKLELIHKDEVDYFQRLLPSCRIKSSEQLTIGHHQKFVVIFLRQTLESMNDADDLNFSNANLSHAVKFFKARGYKIFLKLHPHSWFQQEDLGKELQNLEFIDSEFSGHDVLQELRPSFVIGWLSSSLIEALNAGIIPVTLETKPYDSDVSKKTIVKFEKRVLNYATDIDKIIAATEQPSEFTDLISVLSS